MTARLLSSCVRLPNAAAFALLVFAAATGASAQDLVISQVYTFGGATNATYRNDYVEVFNRGTTSVALAGKSIQYASATGAGNFAVNSITQLAGTLEPGQYYLVQMAAGPNGTPLPTPDAQGSASFAIAGGKVALVNSTQGLPCNGGSTPCSPADAAKIIDLVGYGSANFFEGTGTAPGPTLTDAILRAAAGCRDSNDNAADFAAAAAEPRNTASPPNACTFAVSCPASLTTLQGNATSALLSAADESGTVSSAAIAGAPVPGIELLDFTTASAIGETATVTLSVSSGTAVGTYPVEVAFVSDARAQSCTVQVDVASVQPGVVRIHDIQSAGHRSPLAGQGVENVPGIVTAVRANGFTMQDPEPDSDPATSEGIFVFTGSPPTVAAGHSVLVTGAVTEFRPGGVDAPNLTSTNLNATAVTVLSTGNPLPAPIVIGSAGRIPPAAVIDGGGCGDVEAAGCTFDPVGDGIDFYESLEGMRVQLDNAVAVGPTSAFGETPVIGDFGTQATQTTPRGGVHISATDFNPERVILDDQIVFPLPVASTGDRLGTVVGVLDYSFGSFKLQVTGAYTIAPNTAARETTLPQAAAELAVAGFNVENLHAGSDPAKLAALAEQIVGSLQAPDIIAVSEVQDNNGPINDAAVDASQTFAALVSAIATAGGPTYHFRNIDPVDDQDGGQPGANIRMGFLFNPARVAFVDRPGGTATDATSVVDAGGAAQLSASPGRVDPANLAFLESRKPLAGEFRFNGHSVIVLANHFNSKGGDSPLFGRYQPPLLPSETQRMQQATVVRGFVRSILAVDANANVVVLGDLNDFQFSNPLSVLRATPLVDLGDQLPDADRYTFVFDGNAQTLDYILVSANLAAGARYDIVHINAEYAERPSDHDAVVARLHLPAREVTGQTSNQISGVVFVRATQLFHGYIRVANAGSAAIEGPIHVLLDGLPEAVTLANRSGAYDGAPYITYPQGLAPGESVTVPVQYSNPQRVLLQFTVRVYSGLF